MNDPNGLLYHQGVYHVFYQYHPDGLEWGPMHWGHATTKDWLHWDHQPIALYPDNLGTIFSGCAVVDIQNSSGLGSAETPPLVALFTYHNSEKEKKEKVNFQSQGMAFSLDNGKTWSKYANNPVLEDSNSTDFRDPKVFWDSQHDQWVMGLAEGDCIGFYRSTNLIHWTLTSRFGKTEGAHGGVWECPDLFPLKDAQGIVYWVLLVSINPGGPEGGSATQYFIGEWNGSEFIPSNSEICWLDQGTDHYAGVTFSNHEEQRLLLGWMNNWKYGQQIPADNYRGCMTAARELFLHTTKGKISLGNRLPSAFTKHFSLSTRVSPNEVHPLSQTTFLLNIEFRADFVLELKNDTGEKITVSYDQKSLLIDRCSSHVNEFHPDFFQPIKNVFHSETGKMQLLIDTSSLEIFTPEGQSWTLLFYLDQPLQTLYNKGLNHIEKCNLNGVLTN